MHFEETEARFVATDNADHTDGALFVAGVRAPDYGRWGRFRPEDNRSTES
jgi:hypothetical protein